MTVFDATCALAKAILSCSAHSRIADALWVLGIRTERPTRLTPPEGEQEKRLHSFGYLARHRDSQFRAALDLNRTLHNDPGRFAALRIELAPLPDSLWNCVSEGDWILSHVLDVIVELIARESRDLAAVAHPYRSHTAFRAPLSAKPSAALEELAPAIERVATALVDNPVVKRMPPSLSCDLDGLLRRMNRLGTAMREKEPHPDEIQLVRGTHPTLSPQEREERRLVADLYALRCSLKAIVNVLFDAFLYQRLFALTEDNLYRVALFSDSLGAGVEVGVQPYDLSLYAARYGQIFMFAPPLGQLREKFRGPGLVLQCGEELNGDFGDGFRVRLRRLDEWMNPYPGLVA